MCDTWPNVEHTPCLFSQTCASVDFLRSAARPCGRSCCHRQADSGFPTIRVACATTCARAPRHARCRANLPKREKKDDRATQTMKHGFELSVAVATQVLQASGGRGINFQLPLWDNAAGILPNGSGERKHRLSRKNCSVTAMIEYREAAASMQCALACWISGFLLPSFLQNRYEGSLALTPAQIISNLQTDWRAEGTDDKRIHVFALLPCRGGG